MLDFAKIQSEETFEIVATELAVMRYPTLMHGRVLGGHGRVLDSLACGPDAHARGVGAHDRAMYAAYALMILLSTRPEHIAEFRKIPRSLCTSLPGLSHMISK